MDQDLKDVIARLREFVPERKRREIAEKAGVGHGWLGDLFKGRSQNPTYGRLKRISDAADAPWDYVVAGYKLSPAKKRLLMLITDEEADDLVPLFERRHPPEGNQSGG